jgi:hypothetical protein
MSQAGYDELRNVIRGVRRRWRLKVALRGAAVVLAVGLGALAVSAYAMDHFRYEPWAVTSFRLFAYVALLALATRFLVLPLWGRVSDERVALYLEENEPSLQAAVLSAVEAGREGRPVNRLDHSPVLVERLVQTAVEKCQTIEYGRPVERRGLRRASALLASAAALGMVVAILSPAFLRHAAPFLLAPWSVRAASPYAIEVDPGNATIPRGGTQAVTARLHGFDAETVELAVRSGQGPDWKRWPMTADEAARGFRFVLFGLEAGSDYFVEAGGVRSAQFRIEVADVPYVKRVDLEYHFPAYTGLSPQTQEDSGDVVALRGTEVRVRVTPTITVAAARLRVDGAPPQAMTVAADGTLEATFKAMGEGFYRIDMPRRDGELQPSSPEYTIDVLSDQPPSITLVKPGRDAKVTAIEEVFTEFEAEDDYGVARAELVYSVNGAPEKTVVLHKGRGKKALSAGHTFFLEELTLEPGDFLSYFARATDQGAPAQTATTDIYFMEVRPFDREYRQADQRGGGGGGGGDDAALSFQQRQIIAATFKLVRDRGRTERAQHGEDVGVLALVQGRLQQQVESLVQRMGNRGVLEPGSEFEKTAESLRSAAGEMKTAKEKLDARKAKDALAPEQAALKHLQRAEAAFRNVQVSFEQGGGAGSGSMNAEDLADLFELELDKLKNQYETVQRGAEQQADNQVDEALERLRELARRQEQEIERQRQLSGRPPNQAGGGGGGRSQQELAKETEDLARRLERLARENSSPAMQETARRLQDAANAMKRGQAGGRGGSMGDSAAALERLKDARRRLESSQSGRTERGIQEARRRAEEMARAQEKIAAEAEQQLAAGGVGQQSGRTSRLMERKDALARDVSDLEGQLDRMAQEARAGKKDAARKLQEAADAIRDRKLRDKIRYSKGVLGAGAAERSRQLEAEIGKDLAALGEKLEQAAGAAGPSDADRRTAALEKMRDLARRLESVQERLRERGGQGARGEEKERGEGAGEQGERAPGEGSPGEDGESEGAASEGSSGSGAGQEGGSRQADGRGQESMQGGAQGGPGGGSPRDGLAHGGPPRFTAGDARQVRRELRERLREAEALGRELGSSGGGPHDLADVVRGMRRFEDEQVYREPRGLARLVGSVVEGLKAAEFALRRDIEGPDREKLFLSGSQDLPPGWQRLVEEYYRSLARKPDAAR